MKTNFYKKSISVIIMFFLFLITIQGQEKSIKIIPVVVHVVYKTSAQNISDQRIYEQIEVLNQDYRRLNSDTNLTPIPFRPVAADCEIEFVLANQTPQGTLTTGIIRVQTTTTAFNNDDKVKHTNMGGSDAWDPTQYYNIWVCNLGNSLCGYSTTPDIIDNNDGLVMMYQYFGLTGAVSPYNKGRTATHETGHWLGLHHIPNENCINLDACNDIPPQSINLPYNIPSDTCGFCSYDSCSPNYPGVMYMNFMSYTVDASVNLFTQCQKLIMNSTLNNARASLMTSQGYTKSGIILLNNFDFDIYPNPVHDFVNIYLKNIEGNYLTITINDLHGRTIIDKQNIANDKQNTTIKLNTQDISNGIYNVKITTRNTSKTKKIEICR